MTAKLGLFVALNLIVFAAGSIPEPPSPTTPTVEPAPSTTYVPEPQAPPPPPPVTPVPSTYGPKPPTPTTPTTDAHGQWSAGRCPVDALKLEVCASFLGGLIKISLPEDRERCCRLLDGLADIDAAACLCTVLNANILNIPLHVPIDISLKLNQCGRTNSPHGFTCPRH
ncbi:hypothetical protein PVAP13_9KG336700 [Panicum virgatum]|uniref:Bifunctional inhibitor/plant lipid transfer protein/seed storage helical domain-containing protein n=1 Tax=Panicum virgatum TaxID=38727 RepID=A0A8T0NN47_PANVG|nr:hypothetical protein PVAP13_9KG336700 [Panicum virgatum]